MEIWGACPHPSNPRKFRGYEIAFHFWAKTMLLLGQTTEFYIHEYLPLWHIALYSTGKPQPLQLRLARLIIRLEQ